MVERTGKGVSYFVCQYLEMIVFVLFRQPHIDRNPERILIHKRYNDATLEYDVALVKIKKVEITFHIKPISLPESKLCHARKRKKQVKGKERKSKKNTIRKGRQRIDRKIQKNKKKNGNRKRRQRNGRGWMRNRKGQTKSGTLSSRQGAKKDKRMNKGNDYSFKVSRFKYTFKYKRTCWGKWAKEII